MANLNAATLKSSSLVLLALQNFAYGLLLPISRSGDKDGNVFFGPTAVVTTELLKIAIALCGLASEKNSNTTTERDSHRRINSVCEKGYQQVDVAHEQETPSSRKSASWIARNTTMIRDIFCQGSGIKLLVPAVLFVLQNNLQIQSASYLDATEFQVLSQLKIVTAAIFSVLILKRHLNIKHWTSILFLIVGICVVQQASVTKTSVSHSQSHMHPQAFLIGSITMLAACCFSGIASILVEYLLKNEIGFWTSNLLLATYSIVPASIPLVADVYNRGQFDIFRYFTFPVWMAIFLNAIGGLLVSMVMKYADNILKGFAIAASLIATVLLQSHSSFSIARVGGTLIVVASMFGYSQASINTTAAPLSPTLSNANMSEKEELPLYSRHLDTVEEEGDTSFGSRHSSPSL